MNLEACRQHFHGTECVSDSCAPSSLSPNARTSPVPPSFELGAPDRQRWSITVEDSYTIRPFSSGSAAALPLVRARKRSYVIRGWPVNLREDALRSIGLAFIGLAVAITMVGLSLTQPAIAKIRKGCGNQQQHQVNQTGECNDIIIENLDRGVSSTGHTYRSNSQKAKRHKRTKSN
jgi:hypothetical protein